MAVRVDPFLHPIPPELRKDKETRAFFEYFTRWAHDMWVRSGGGNDEIAAEATRELFPWDITEQDLDNVSNLFQWQPSTTGQFRATTESTDYTALPFDFVNATTGATITFPEYPQENDIIMIRNGDGSRIKLNGNGKTINGSSTGELSREGTAIEFYYFIDSDEWVAK